MTRVLCSCLLLFLTIATSPAKPSGIQVRFAAQDAPRDLGDLVMATADTRSEAFAVPLNNLSIRYEAPARGFALLSVDKKTTLAKVVLPESGNDFIILLIITEKAGFTPIVLPAKGNSFKPGDVYLHNTSKKLIVGLVGTTKFSLKPAKGTIVRPAGAREGRFYDVAFAVRENGDSRLISTTRWPVDNHTRSYVFFFNNPARRDIDFRAIDEFVPLTKK